jgi:hypothetical protein
VPFAKEVPGYTERHRVKSGITGWAQVNGLRGQTSIADRVEFDNYYIENWSLGLDLRILALTVVELLRFRDGREDTLQDRSAQHTAVSPVGSPARVELAFAHRGRRLARTAHTNNLASTRQRHSYRRRGRWNSRGCDRGALLTAPSRAISSRFGKSPSPWPPVLTTRCPQLLSAGKRPS